MPAYKTPKYSKEKTQEITMTALGAVCDASIPLTIDEIKFREVTLAMITPQKIARCLSDLAERGLVIRGKNDNGRVTYMSIETHAKFTPKAPAPSTAAFWKVESDGRLVGVGGKDDDDETVG